MSAFAVNESLFEECGFCSKGSSTTVPRCPHCSVLKSSVRKVVKIGQPMPVAIMKRADERTSETETPVEIYKRAHQDFESGLEAFTKANVGKGINAYLQTDEGRELATKANEAHAAVAAEYAPGRYVTAEKAAGRASAFEALEQGLTAFCKAQNITKVWNEGLAKFRETDEGRALSDAYDETR